jgi:hypothetical protein
VFKKLILFISGLFTNWFYAGDKAAEEKWIT